MTEETLKVLCVLPRTCFPWPSELVEVTVLGMLYKKSYGDLQFLLEMAIYKCCIYDGGLHVETRRLDTHRSSYFILNTDHSS